MEIVLNDQLKRNTLYRLHQEIKNEENLAFYNWKIEMSIFLEEESEEEHKFFAKDYMTNSSFENSSQAS